MPANVRSLALVVLASAPKVAFASPGDESRPPLFLQVEHLVVRPGKVVDGAKILVRDGRIAAVGTDLKSPEGARVVDGKYACAAFLDAWSALGVGIDVLADQGTTAATRTSDGLDPWGEEHLRRQALRSGVTVVRTQAGATARIGGLGAVVRIAPDLKRDDAVLSSDGDVWMTIGLTPASPQQNEGSDVPQLVAGLGERTPDPFERIDQVDRLVSSLQSGRSYLISKNEYKHELEDWQKKIAEKETELEKDAKKAKKDREKEEKDAKEKNKKFEEKKYKEDKKPTPPRYDEDNEVLARVVDGQVPLFVDAHREAEIRGLLAGTAEMGRLRMVLAGATNAAWHSKELAERHVPVLLAPVPVGRYAPDELEGSDLALAGLLAKDGVDVVIGSGGYDPAATRDLPLLAALAVAHGLSRDDALEAITIGAARVLDLDRRLGTVEVGKDADVIVLDGPPLDSSSRVLATISAGRVVDTKEN